jgi:hypothetical protein
LALDIAMGLGVNAGYLLDHGLRVVGVDISNVAVTQVKKEFPAIIAVIADIERFFIPPAKFDVILNFLYLQRNLWPDMIRGLKLGGLLFIECLTEDMLIDHPEIDPIYLLKPGELQGIFTTPPVDMELEILHYFEGWSSSASSHRRAVASMIGHRLT